VSTSSSTVISPLTPSPAQTASDPYLGRLAEDDQEVYQATTGDLDLTHEIRLMRTVLAHLAGDIAANRTVLASLLGALVRAVSIQASQLAGARHLEQVLVEVGERVLAEDRWEVEE
jgi:hypothetical protein